MGWWRGPWGFLWRFMPPSRPLSTGSSSFHATYWFENGSIGAMLQPTARPLPRPILGLAVSESEMGFAATEGPLRAEQGVSLVTSVVVQKVNRKRSLGIVKVGNNKLFAHWPTSHTYINLGVVVLVRMRSRTPRPTSCCG